MSEEAEPAGGKDAYTRDRLQRIARLIDEELPAGWGFGLLVFPFNGEPGRCNYIANGHRDGVVAEMKAFIKRSEEAGSDDEFYKHHKK